MNIQHPEKDKLPENPNTNINVQNTENTETQKVLCPHCKRTAINGIKCKGICVADSDY